MPLRNQDQSINRYKIWIIYLITENIVWKVYTGNIYIVLLKTKLKKKIWQYIITEIGNNEKYLFWFFKSGTQHNLVTPAHLQLKRLVVPAEEIYKGVQCEVTLSTRKPKTSEGSFIVYIFTWILINAYYIIYYQLSVWFINKLSLKKKMDSQWIYSIWTVIYILFWRKNISKYMYWYVYTCVKWIQGVCKLIV